MRFELIRVASLPRLAWCAHLRRGHDVVRVYHGPWVETRPNWFVEGAWSGSFSDGQFVDADYLAGSGGRAEERQVVFAAASNLADRIYSQQKGDDLYLSNSAPFVLEMSGDVPDPVYLDYAADRRRQQRYGIRVVDKRLPTASGIPVRLHEYCSLAVGSDLTIRRIEKPETPEPRSYADYVAQIERVIAGVHANAADPARKHQRYRPVATLSRGYDCNALAAVMARLGAREAFTFNDVPDDDGTAIGERLGYEVAPYSKLAFQNLPGIPEAEFQATPWGSDVVMASCEPQLVGALLVTGRRGDTLFKVGEVAPPMLAIRGYSGLAGSMMNEFRLRVGFVHFLPYYVAALHPLAVHRITMSHEMRPWSVGGNYDRPILRRLIEEAGVPRDWFGRQKLAGAHVLPRQMESLTPASAADFTAFLKTLPPIPRGRRLAYNSQRMLFSAALVVSRFHRKTLHTVGIRALGPRSTTAGPVGTMTRNIPIELSRLFHWGVARVRSRYAIQS